MPVINYPLSLWIKFYQIFSLLVYSIRLVGRVSRSFSCFGTHVVSVRSELYDWYVFTFCGRWKNSLWLDSAKLWPASLCGQWLRYSIDHRWERCGLRSSLKTTQLGAVQNKKMKPWKESHNSVWVCSAVSSQH